jgi:hypothetical protein
MGMQQCALLTAVRAGNTAAVKELIAAGTDANYDRYGRVALAGLLSNGSLAAVRRAGLCLCRLLESVGPSYAVCLLCRGDNVPLHVASENGHTETAMALVQAGADVQRRNYFRYGRGVALAGLLSNGSLADHAKSRALLVQIAGVSWPFMRRVLAV